MKANVNFTAKVMLILMLFVMCVFAAVEGHRNASSTAMELRLQKQINASQMQLIDVMDSVLVNNIQCRPIESIRELRQFLVTATKYNAVPEQTDSSPYHTADGSFIDTALLRTGHVRWVALSRDLLKRHGGHFEYGDTLYLYSSNEAINGPWVVHDCMHKRYDNRVDILQPLGVNKISGHTKAVLSETRIKPCRR